MNERTIVDWKQWFEDVERRKLTEGSIPLSSIRPKGAPIRLLDGRCDGVHPLPSTHYERNVDGTNRRND